MHSSQQLDSPIYVHGGGAGASADANTSCCCFIQVGSLLTVMVLASLSRSRAGAGRHALLLLATVLACFMAVQGLRTPPKIDGFSPNTKLSSFKSTFAAYTSDMSRLVSLQRRKQWMVE